MTTSVETHSGLHPLNWSSIREYATGFPDESPEEIARRYVSRLADAEIRAFAILHAEAAIDCHRRQLARDSERRHELNGWDLGRSEELGQKGGSVSREPDIAGERFPGTFVALRDNPSPETYLTNVNERKAFRRWMGSGWDEWYVRRHEKLTTDGDIAAVEYFEADWHPFGRSNYLQEKMFGRLALHVEEFSRTLRLQLTEELLETKFALGDGTETTWGDATRDQHDARAKQLVKHATGTAETAARHLAAIRMLEEGGEDCLRSLTVKCAV